MSEIKKWQDRMPAPRRAFQCDMNCSNAGKHPRAEGCGDCMPITIHGDPIAARDEEIAELRAALATRPADVEVRAAAFGEAADIAEYWASGRKEKFGGAALRNCAVALRAAGAAPRSTGGYAVDHGAAPRSTGGYAVDHGAALNKAQRCLSTLRLAATTGRTVADFTEVLDALAILLPLIELSDSRTPVGADDRARQEARDKALEDAAQIAIRHTGIPFDAIRRGTGVRDRIVIEGENIAAAIRALRSPPVPGQEGESA